MERRKVKCSKTAKRKRKSSPRISIQLSMKDHEALEDKARMEGKSPKTFLKAIALNATKRKRPKRKPDTVAPKTAARKETCDASDFHKEWIAIKSDWLKNEASDHACVLINATLLQNCLGESIYRILLGNAKVRGLLLDRDGGIDRPLSGLSARIHAGFVFGLYGKKTYVDLKVIRDMRNNFAHVTLEKSHDKKKDLLSFNHKAVAEQCQLLKVPDHFPRLDHTQWKPGVSIRDAVMLPPMTDPKERFEYTINTVVLLLVGGDPSARPRIVIDGKTSLP